MAFENQSDLITQTFKQLLLKCNTNAYRIAKETGIDKTYLSKLSTGAIAKPGQDKLAKIAAVLDIELEQLKQVFCEPNLAIANLGLESVESTETPQANKSSTKSRHDDWGTAPDGTICYQRQREIEKIKQLIELDCCRVLTIFGMAGIGKTVLTMEVARQLKTEFEHVFWRTLSNVSLPEMVIQDALKLFTSKKNNATIERQIVDLLQYLRNYRSLLILDGVETILAAGNSANIYQNGHQIYGELFQQIAHTQHQSCLILVGNEKPRDIYTWESHSASIYSLQIQGSSSVCCEILKDKGMLQTPAWDELIEAYHQHPLAIKIVASTIAELFDGDVAEFLRQNTLFLGDLEFILHEQYCRLADAEKYIINIIAQMNKPLSLQELSEQYATGLRCSEIINCLDSLKRRSLIEIIARPKSWQKGFKSSAINSIERINFYTIQPIVRKYITSQTTSSL